MGIFYRVSIVFAACAAVAGFGSACGDGSPATGDSGPTTDGTTNDSSNDVSSNDAKTDATCTNGDPNVDQDGDGWTPAQGDCNDCDPHVNPGAVDVEHAVDGGFTYTDDDCDGTAGSDLASCGEGLALDDVVADDAVKAIELCRRASATTRSWGVESAQYVRASGVAFATPGLQTGIEPTFGPNVSPRSGGTMLLLSTGNARTPNQPGACGSNSCKHNTNASVPSGFPQHPVSCTTIDSIADDIGLSVKIRVPTNAVGFSFDTAFYTFGFPVSPCSKYSDQTIALVTPAPVGSANGNVLFDTANRPIGTDTAFIESCDPNDSSAYAKACVLEFGTCPSAPNPYCPLGSSALAGTGFDAWGGSPIDAGATPWMRTTVPVTPASEITIQFTIWDAGDQSEDSSVLFDHFHWITSGTVTTSTTLVP